MIKKLLVLLMLVAPFMVNAADSKKKDEPVVHLTDEQIYQELKKLALIF